MSSRGRVAAGVIGIGTSAAALWAALACAAAPPTSGPAAPLPAAGPVIDACPKELSVRQTVTAEVAGWTSVNPQENYPFVRIVFYDGPPSDDKRVVPSFENRTSTGLHDGWTLPKHPAGYWLQCQYGNTTAAVNRRLDDANNFCVADYDPHFATLVVRHWACMPGKTPPPASRATMPRAKLVPKWTHTP